MSTLPPNSEQSEPDLIDEIRLRTWARRHYVRAEDRDSRWHPVILDEMRNKDREGGVKLSS